MIDTLLNLIREDRTMAQPIHEKFLIAVDENEPLVRLMADMRRDGYVIDLDTNPPTLRRAPSNVVTMPVRQQHGGAMPPGSLA